MEYIVHLAILITLYLVLAGGFNVVFGLAGLFNLAHVAAYAVGAYSSALLSVDAGVSAPFCFIASIAAGSLCGVVGGALASRLRQEYFAIGTMALSAVVLALVINWRSLTRGVLGVPGIPRPEFTGVSLDDNAAFLGLSAAIALVGLILLQRLFYGPGARELRGLAEFEEGAVALGVSPRRARMRASCVAASMAGAAGALFAYYLNYIDPSSFGLAEMIFVLTIVIVGAPGSLWGMVGATVFLVLLPEALRFLDLSSSILGPMRQLLNACILILVLFLNRDKLFAQQRRV